MLSARLSSVLKNFDLTKFLIYRTSAERISAIVSAVAELEQISHQYQHQSHSPQPHQSLHHLQQFQSQQQQIQQPQTNLYQQPNQQQSNETETTQQRYLQQNSAIRTDSDSGQKAKPTSSGILSRSVPKASEQSSSSDGSCGSDDSEVNPKMSSEMATNCNGDHSTENGNDHSCSSSNPNNHPQQQQVAPKSSATGESCFASSSLGDIIKFLELVGSLKHIKRTGWVMRDVKDCESISGHMYRMSMMSFLLDGKDGLNRTRCMELALVHDLAECLVGDITPFCGVSREEKRLREQKAMEEICKLVQPNGDRMLKLFMEYEANESPESKFVKDLDRLDMVLQAFEYEKRDNCVMKHQEFFDSTDGKFNHPLVVKLVDEIYSQRKALAAGTIQNGCAPSIENHHEQNGHAVDSDISEKKVSTS